MYASPQYRLNEHRQYAADLMDRLSREMDKKLTDQKYRLELCAGRLDALSPLKKLRQGYSYTELSDQKALRSISQVRTGDVVTVHVTDGKILARVETTEAMERNE